MTGAGTRRACPRCDHELGFPVGCVRCGVPLALADGLTPYDLLGLEPGFELDERELRSRLLRASRIVHPDFFGTAPADVRELAERASASLNRAFALLSDPVERADWLILHLGGPAEGAERAMPKAFLAEVLEWSEVLAEARAASGQDPRLAALERELLERRGAALATLRALLVPLPAPSSPALADARRELNAVRYLERALGEVESLRLLRAETR
jgi:molecular chaperone HscB